MKSKTIGYSPSLANYFGVSNPSTKFPINEMEIRFDLINDTVTLFALSGSGWEQQLGTMPIPKFPKANIKTKSYSHFHMYERAVQIERPFNTADEVVKVLINDIYSDMPILVHDENIEVLNHIFSL